MKTVQKSTLVTLVLLLILSSLGSTLPEARADTSQQPVRDNNSGYTMKIRLPANYQTFIRSSAATTNYDTNSLVLVGEDNASAEVDRGLVTFDLTRLTSVAAQITSATLNLPVSADHTDNARTLRAYQVRQTYVSSQATWNVYSTGNSWATAGATNTTSDIYGTDVGSVSVSATPSGTVSVSLTAARVQDWVDGTTTNNGLLLKVDTETNDLVSYTASGIYLEVTYTTDYGVMPANYDTSMISSAATTNYDSSNSVYVGEDNGSASVRRGLLKFDVSALANIGAIVTDAKLLLTTSVDSSSNTRTLRAYQVRRAYVSSQATWNVYRTGNNWTTAGAGDTTNDIYGTDIGSVSVPNDNPTYTTVAIDLDNTSVQNWVDGTTTNNGLLLKFDTETNDLWEYFSHDFGIAYSSYAPTLVIDYTTAPEYAYAVTGASLSSGSVTVSSAAGNTISGLTVGNWYAVTTSGGPWNSPSTVEYDSQLALDGVMFVDSKVGNGIAHVDSVSTYYETQYFKATNTSIKIRVQDYSFGDNTGSLSYDIYPAAAIPVASYLDYIHQTDAVSTYAWLDGSGYTVAILDTGINTSNSRFTGHTIYQYDYVDNDATAEDTDGHGTSVAGVVADVCPDCDIAMLKVTTGASWWDGISTITAMTNALQWVIDNRVSKNIVAVNISRGSEGTFFADFDLNPYHSQFQELVSAGVVITASGGNDYVAWQQPGAEAPASDSLVLGVSSVFHADIGAYTSGDAEAYTTRAGQLVPWAERHANLTPIVAPGVDIPSANTSGSTTLYEGTSYSAPMVAAAVALVQDAAEYVGDPLDAQSVINTLLSTGSVTTDAYPDGTDNVLHTSSQFRVLNILAAVNGVQNTSLVWQEGNYIEDGDMETWTLWDGTAWGSWSSYPAFSQSQDDSWSSVGPICGDNFRVMDSMVVGTLQADPSMGSYIPPSIYSEIDQTFLWYGGDLYLSFAYMTSASAQLKVQLLDPFGRLSTVTSGLTNTASQWKTYYTTLTGKPYGRYTLIIEVSGGTGSPAQQAAIDAVTVSEGGHQHCPYQLTPLTPPPAAGSFSQKSPPSLTFNTGNLIANAPFDVAGFANYWATSGIASHLSTGGLTGDGAVSLFGAPNTFGKALESIGWIQVGSNVGELGDTLAQTEAAPGDTVFVSSTLNAGDQSTVTLTPYLFGFIKLEEIDTGILYSPTSLETIFEGGEPDPGDTPWFTPVWVFEHLPLGDYRVVITEDNEFTSNGIQVLIDDICGATDFLVISTLCIPISFTSSESELQGTLAGPQATATANVANTQQAASVATGTALAYSNATSTTRAQATQTQLVINGNQTQYVIATATQRYVLTATPRAAVTQTAVSANVTATRRAGLTATATRVAATQTQVAVYAVTSAWMSTMQAQATATAHWQETEEALPPIIAQLTLQAQIIQTNAALLTQQANGQNTAVANVTSTANATAYFQATQIAQLNATMQAMATNQATQAQGGVTVTQVVPVPVPQPGNYWTADCVRPNGWLLDYVTSWLNWQVCALTNFFAPQPHNFEQWQALQGANEDREPFGTINEVTGAISVFKTETAKYDWQNTGQTTIEEDEQQAQILLQPQLGVYAGYGINFNTPIPSDYLAPCNVQLPGAGAEFLDGVCWGLAFLKYWGFLAWVQIMINSMSLVAFVVYAIFWARRTLNG